MWLPEENSRTVTSFDEDYLEKTPRKRVRIRVPVVRKNGRQHKLTVVRRRPITSKVEEPPLTVTSHIPRRIVVTRVRTLGLANSIYSDLETDSFKPEIGKHKVTITRRRKIGSTTVTPTSTEKRVKITRRKLIAVRPVQPTPSFAIITTGFFTAPSSEYDEEYFEEDNDEEMENKEDVTSTVTPELKEPPNVIDSKPDEIEIESKTEEIEPKVVDESIMGSSVIITDNFFFPPSDDEDEDEYEEEYMDTTTEEENANEEISMTTKSTKDEDGNVSNREDTLTIFMTPMIYDLPKKKETALEKSEETSYNVADHETSTISVDSKQEEKSEEVLTTVKSTKDKEIITTTQESFEETLEENVPTTYPDIKEDDEKEYKKEKEYATTVETIETTVPMEETTVITVPEEKTETVIVSDRETTTIAEEEEKINNTEHPISSTETSFQDSSSENKESQKKDIEYQVTTIAIDFENSSPKNREGSLEKYLEPNTTLIETDDSEKKSLFKNTEDSLKKDIESHVTVTQIESKDFSQIDTEDYQEKDIKTQITKVQIEPETLKEPTEDPNKETQSLSIDNHPIIITISSSKLETERSFSPPDTIDFILKKMSQTTINSEEKEDNLTVQPIEPITEFTSSTFFIDVSPSFASVLPLETSQSLDSNTLSYLDDSEIPSVIPLGVEYMSDSKSTSVIFEATPSIEGTVTTSISSPTPEEIEAGLADDLYLSLSRPDFPKILPSKPMEHVTRSETPDLEPSTSIYYTETVVTSTRLRTYTYVVTQLNGLETKVTSSTTVRPRVTTLTLTVPVTVTVTPTVESSAYSVSSVYSPVPVAGE
ncbi:rho GTPase-activating protein gacF-like [Apis laboriosa]|uniref:rho GTPase-activating protein gacF-like n=1 Tax=Apis laboriosa TaxID=183418 RepID=UPI001CC700BE|nr:rho GTPase-activating protein gacF-like [Apis laboriosa]